MYKLIRNFFNGLAFGATQVVPGVSGGTIAIILGFYHELIQSINNFSKDKKKYSKFLMPFAIGIGAGIVLFGWIANYLLSNYSFPTMLFFIGLILGIVPLIFNKIKDDKYKLKDLILIIIPMLILIITSHLKGISITEPAEFINGISLPFMIFLLIAGIIAAAALVIPGVSGSFVLLLLGVYPLATYAVSLISNWFTDMTNISLFISINKVLLPLAIGVIIGGLTTIRIIENLLNNHTKVIYSIILGLVIGSVYALAKDPIVYQSGIDAISLATGFITLMLGITLSVKLGGKRI